MSILKNWNENGGEGGDAPEIRKLFQRTIHIIGGREACQLGLFAVR